MQIHSAEEEFSSGPRKKLRDKQKQIIASALEQFNGSFIKAAKHVGLSHPTLKKHAIAFGIIPRPRGTPVNASGKYPKMPPQRSRPIDLDKLSLWDQAIYILILTTLIQTKGALSPAARRLGKSLPTIRSKARKLGLWPWKPTKQHEESKKIHQ